MYCSKCGNKINEGNNFCTKCGFQTNQIIKAENNNQLDNQNKETKEATILSIASILLINSSEFFLPLLYYQDPLLNIIIDSLRIFFPIVGLFLIVIAIIKYPQNKLVKAIVWIYIICATILVFLYRIFSGLS